MSTLEATTGPQGPAADSTVNRGSTTADDRGRRAGVLWAGSTVLAVLVIALVPVLFDPRFYFADDTQNGAFGVWWSIGEQLRHGTIPYFEPSRWMAGNYVAEGQWGTFSPVTLVIGLLARASADAVVFTTALKLFFICVGALGVYLLVRNYGASRVWALAAGVSTPLAGFTAYMDSTSWVTGLFAFCLLPWAWLTLRRLAQGTGGPVPAVIAGYLVVSIGYVHGTIALALLIVSLLVEFFVVRRAATVRLLVAGCLIGLVAVAVHLPSLLTASVTARSGSAIANDNFVAPEVSGLLTSWIATSRPWMDGFWSVPTPAPLLYVSWLLPLLVFVRLPEPRRFARGTIAIWVFAALVSVIVFGPSMMGPLRFPGRMLPYVALCLIAVTVLMLSKGSFAFTRGRRVAAISLYGLGFFLSLAETPSWWKAYALAAALGLAGVLVIARTAARAGSTWQRTVAGTFVLVTLLLTVVQHHYLPSSPFRKVDVPTSTAAYASALEGVEGDVFVVGDPRKAGAPWDELLFANLWYLNDADVQNVYSPVAHAAYREAICTKYAPGTSCFESLEKLFEVDETTGLPLVDLLSVNSIAISRRDDVTTDGPENPFVSAEPPAGWHEQWAGEYVRVWTRDVPVPTAGGIVALDDGVEVSDVRVTKTSVTFRVDEAPADGGSIVFSRLNWPGYSFENAVEAAPTRDFLLTAEVSGADDGKTVVVRFAPAGWSASLAAMGAAVLGTILWGVLAAVRRRRPAGSAG
ncbi:hypothetical protein [Cellulosimicrobium sp. NPDC057862]|uniref:hypothetical protein n=1 Tax=Cellulosimicrobium sp. NPDC057862 TaxID=3346266 RepID=UPI00366BC8F7